MHYTRLYSDKDGESHFEDVEVPLEGREGQDWWGTISPFTRATSYNFRINGPAYDFDWHPAPQRQMILNLTGTVRIEVSDGEVRVFGPGTALLVEDTTGRGHISKAVGGEERVSVWVQLP